MSVNKAKDRARKRAKSDKHHKRGNRGTVNVSLKTDKKQSIICGRFFKVKNDSDITDDVEWKIRTTLTRIIGHLDEVDRRPYGRTDDTDAELIISVLLDDKLVHEMSADISHYKRNTKYKIDIRAIMPDVINDISDKQKPT